MKRVSLIDDHAVFRRGVKALLAETGEFDICAECATVESAQAHFHVHRCEVALLDIDMPGKSGLDALPRLVEAFPWLRVVLLSFHPEQQYATRALQLGARGYVCKAEAEQHLIPAIHAAAGNRHFVTPGVATQMLTTRSGPSLRPHELLSDRELQVMTLLVQGNSNAEISTTLGLSPKTVSTYRGRLLEKLAVRSTAELVRYAIDHDLA